MSRCPECNVNGVIVKDGCLTCGGWGIVPDITVSEHEEAIAEKDQRIAALEAERDGLRTKLKYAESETKTFKGCWDAACNDIATLTDENESLQARLGEVEQERTIYHESNNISTRLANNLKLRAEAAEAEVAFLKSKGLTVANAKDADKPEYLAYVIEEGSELCDLKTVNKLVDAEAKLAAVREIHDSTNYGCDIGRKLADIYEIVKDK